MESSCTNAPAVPRVPELAYLGDALYELYCFAAPDRQRQPCESAAPTGGGHGVCVGYQPGPSTPRRRLSRKKGLRPVAPATPTRPKSKNADIAEYHQPPPWKPCGLPVPHRATGPVGGIAAAHPEPERRRRIIWHLTKSPRDARVNPARPMGSPAGQCRPRGLSPCPGGRPRSRSLRAGQTRSVRTARPAPTASVPGKNFTPRPATGRPGQYAPQPAPPE